MPRKVDFDRDEARRRYNAGETMHAVALSLGVSDGTVRKAIPDDEVRRSWSRKRLAVRDEPVDPPEGPYAVTSLAIIDDINGVEGVTLPYDFVEGTRGFLVKALVNAKEVQALVPIPPDMANADGSIDDALWKLIEKHAFRELARLSGKETAAR